MQMFHRFVIGATAFVLVACSTETSSNSSSPSTATSSAVSTAANAPLQLPVVSGEWKAAGDLCKVLTAENAREILGHAHTLINSYSADSLPAGNGIDACDYRDPSASAGLGTNLKVQRIDDPTWAKTLQEAQAAGPVQRFTVTGVDEAIVTAANQALVKRGDIMASALNSSAGKFDADGLVKLAAVAANVVA